MYPCGLDFVSFVVSPRDNAFLNNRTRTARPSPRALLDTCGVHTRGGNKIFDDANAALKSLSNFIYYLFGIISSCIGVALPIV